jgi:hypothetical protein
MTIAVDQTDLLNEYPAAAQLLLPLGLKDNLSMGVTVTVQPLTDRDVNPTFTFTLEREDALTGNKELRPAVVTAYIKKVQRCLDSLRPQKPMKQSIIFRSVVEQANRLLETSTQKRYLVMISDLMEHAETDFYDQDTQYALAHDPEQMQQRLEKNLSLRDMKGIELWLLYRPDNYRTNQTYRIVSGFYQRLFSLHGAVVHIDQNFNPQ